MNYDKNINGNKVINFDRIKELKDPIRNSEGRITNDDIVNLKLDLYLFGKGANINE